MNKTLKERNIEILKQNGYEHQFPIWVEELSELTKALCKEKRYGSLDDNKKLYDDIVEELADVLICIDQIKAFYGINECEINDVYDFKISREEERINLTNKN